MAITKTIEGTQAIFVVDGWLDTQTAPELAAELDALEESIESLELDLSELEYISSAGVRQIVAAHKKVSGSLTISNVRPEVFEALRLTGVATRLNIV